MTTERTSAAIAVATVKAAYSHALSKGESPTSIYISLPFKPPPTTGNCMECDGTGYLNWLAIAEQFNPEGYYEADPCDACGCTGHTLYARLEQEYELRTQLEKTNRQLLTMLEELLTAVDIYTHAEDAPMSDLEETYERISAQLDPDR